MRKKLFHFNTTNARISITNVKPAPAKNIPSYPLKMKIAAIKSGPKSDPNPRTVPLMDINVARCSIGANPAKRV